MPKIRIKGHPDPYMEHLHLGQMGARRYGSNDRLLKRMAQDFSINSSWKEGRKTKQYFEYSDNPFYNITRYIRTREGKSKFVREEVAVNAPGGIFNLEFNSDGKILAAACEKKNILIFDPLRREVVHSLNDAHTDCVNCIRFLDQRTFASCSDDTSVVLWDVRNLKHRVRTFKGHSNWVKNIEYNSRDSLLVTSGFDGAIHTWDINKYQEREEEYRRVFYTNGLMRMRLTAGCDKMVISTMNGYLVVLHDLDLDTLGQDLAGFKPNVYRLMQMSGKPIEMAVNYTHLFHAKRNRVELISDFPEGNDAEVLSSLKLHPQGWVAVTRNTNSDEKSEWCTVHDIQTLATDPELDTPVQEVAPLRWARASQPARELPVPSIEEIENDPSAQRYRAGNIEIISTGVREETGPRPVITIDLNIRRRARRLQVDEQEDREDEGIEDRNGQDDLNGIGIEVGTDNNSRDVERGEEVLIDNRSFLSANSLSALEMFGHLRNGNGVADDSRPSQEDESETDQSEERPNRRVVVIGGAANTGGRPRFMYFGTREAHRAQQARIPQDAKLHKNVQRLTHYVEECNKGKGFIKEQSFSPCGRFIASPFGFGVRLLAFSDTCSDLSTCAPAQGQPPVKLYEVGSNYGHNEVVLSTAFSPTHWLLATGCLHGRISWHQPQP